MKDSTSDNQLAEIARKCIHLNNDHPLVPLLAVITPLINKNTNATHDCHLWQATFAELVQASLRGFSLTSTLLYGYFNLILTDSGNEGDDWSYAFKSHFINAAAKNSSLSKEARHLISYSLQSLNDLEGALEILSIDDDSKFNELAIALRDAIGEGSEKSIYDSEKVFNEICSLDMKISKLFTLFFTEQNLEEFKKVMEPRYVGIILCYSIVAGIDLTKDMVEALEAYPRNVLLQALPFDNLETSVMMYLESAKVNVEKGNYLVTESSDDVNVLNISNQLKICYLNKFCQSELC
uniref:RPN1_RPN2_N domain-containing protein n=1 Tax=Rhabditophanes sp. KR3021 TaxID=114890 RepID=A0AC35UHS6_9BILA